MRETPTAHPVVCVHGFMVDGDLWASTSRELGNRARVLRPTLPLGSHRTPVDQAPTPRRVAESVVAFCDELGLEDPILLGNDTGGAICQLAIHTQPRRIRRLVLTNCDAFDVFPPFPFNALRPASKVPGLLTAALQAGRAPALRHLLLYGVLASRRHEELWQQWIRPYLDDPAIRRQALGFLQAVEPAELLEATRSLGSWSGEALLCWGKRDAFFRESLARRLADVLSAPLVEIDHSRTFVPLDAPAELADAVADFAERTRPAPSATPAGG